MLEFQTLISPYMQGQEKNFYEATTSYNRRGRNCRHLEITESTDHTPSQPIN